MSLRDKEAWRAYQREWVAARRAAYFANKSCVKCDSTDSLELDHVDPRQKIDHRIWSWSEARRNEEISKCQILCHDCHLAKSVENGDLATPRPGETNPGATATNAQVLQMRELYSSGQYTQLEIAAIYNMPRSTVGHMIRGTHKWSSI